MTDRLNEICWFCLGEVETNDGVFLCHRCYNIFADPTAPFYAPNLIQPGGFESAMSDPFAMMWIQQRMESVK